MGARHQPAPLARDPALRGLLPLPGSKKALLDPVFALIAEALPTSEWPSRTFVDPFAGSCAVALTAKRHGFGLVVAGDIAERSAVFARALIANSRRRLTHEEALFAFTPGAPTAVGPSRLSARLGGPLRDLFEDARMCLAGADFSGVQRDLLYALTLNLLVRAFPLGSPSATDAAHVAAGDFDRVTGPRLAHFLRRQTEFARPAAWLRMAAHMNAAVSPGNAVARKGDALATLVDAQGDVVFLDPPYAATTNYEGEFELVDEFIGAPRLATSRFSKSTDPLHELLEAARSAEVVVLTYGNAQLTANDVVEVVERHRHVRRVLVVPHRHLGAVATPTKNTTNREILVVATP
jgi:adenine-specific DNA methylase